MMKKWRYLALLPIFLLVLTSCGSLARMNAMINETTHAIQANREAIHRNTGTIHQNSELIKDSNKTIEENQRYLETLKNAS